MDKVDHVRVFTVLLVSAVFHLLAALHFGREMLLCYVLSSLSLVRVIYDIRFVPTVVIMIIFGGICVYFVMRKIVTSLTNLPFALFIIFEMCQLLRS